MSQFDKFPTLDVCEPGDMYTVQATIQAAINMSAHAKRPVTMDINSIHLTVTGQSDVMELYKLYLDLWKAKFQATK